MLISATPVTNGPPDFEGYIKLAEAGIDTTHKPTKEQLAAAGGRLDQNPYMSDPGQPGGGFQVWQWFFQKYCTDLVQKDPEAAADVLRCLYKRMIIRRTYASSSPSNGAKTLRDDLPELHYEYKRVELT